VNNTYSGYQCPVRREIQHPAIDRHCLCMYFLDLVLCIHFAATAGVCVGAKPSEHLHCCCDLFIPNLNS